MSANDQGSSCSKPLRRRADVSGRVVIIAKYLLVRIEQKKRVSNDVELL